MGEDDYVDDVKVVKVQVVKDRMAKLEQVEYCCLFFPVFEEPPPISLLAHLVHLKNSEQSVAQQQGKTQLCLRIHVILQLLLSTRV